MYGLPGNEGIALLDLRFFLPGHRQDIVSDNSFSAKFQLNSCFRIP